MISDFGGLVRPMPWFSALFVIASLSSIGLPFLNGFVRRVSHHARRVDVPGRGPSMDRYYAGGHRRNLGRGLHALDAAKVVFGQGTSEANRKLTDMNLREALLMLPLLVLMFFMGVYPRPFL
jgi:NADH-quinone oxidoreductase subunit M